MSEQSNPTPEQLPETVNEPTEHLRFLATALQVANKRGIFELEEAGNVQESIKFFNLENETRDEEEQTKHLQRIVGMTEVAQKRGAFNLAEAHTVYPHVKYFVREPAPEPVVKEESNVTSKEPVTENTHCGKDTCDKDTCPCDPNSCPCDTDNCCGKEENVTATIEKTPQPVDRELDWDSYRKQ